MKSDQPQSTDNPFQEALLASTKLVHEGELQSTEDSALENIESALDILFAIYAESRISRRNADRLGNIHRSVEEMMVSLIGRCE